MEHVSWTRDFCRWWFLIDNKQDSMYLYPHEWQRYDRHRIYLSLIPFNGSTEDAERVGYLVAQTGQLVLDAMRSVRMRYLGVDTYVREHVWELINIGLAGIEGCMYHPDKPPVKTMLQHVLDTIYILDSWNGRYQLQWEPLSRPLDSRTELRLSELVEETLRPDLEVIGASERSLVVEPVTDTGSTWLCQRKRRTQTR